MISVEKHHIDKSPKPKCCIKDLKIQHRKEIIMGVNTGSPQESKSLEKLNSKQEMKGRTITLHKNTRAYLPTLGCEYEGDLEY